MKLLALGITYMFKYAADGDASERQMCHTSGDKDKDDIQVTICDLLLLLFSLVHSSTSIC